jgi:hypothetical protein
MSKLLSNNYSTTIVNKDDANRSYFNLRKKTNELANKS